jgi:hypothetical protein
MSEIDMFPLTNNVPERYYERTKNVSIVRPSFTSCRAVAILQVYSTFSLTS